MTKMILTALGCVVFGVSSLALADDYTRDPAPKEMIDRNLERYQAPQHRGACSLYLENLRYFAQRNEPLSCGQPIAPMLKDKIKKVEWEDLDPTKYPDLFKAVIKEARFVRGEPSETELDERRREIKEGGVVFRRLKLDLKGYPAFTRENDPSRVEKGFSILQYGNDVTSPNNPRTTWRCHSRRGRITQRYTDKDELKLFVVTKDLTRIYGRLVDWKGYSGQNLWLINDHVYGELYDEKGTVKLTELRVAFPIHLEPVCLYLFKTGARKE